MAKRASRCVGADVMSISKRIFSPASGQSSTFASEWPGSYKSPVRIPFEVSVFGLVEETLCID